MYSTHICNHLCLYSVQYGLIPTFSTLMHHCMGHSGPRHFLSVNSHPLPPVEVTSGSPRLCSREKGGVLRKQILGSGHSEMTFDSPS